MYQIHCPKFLERLGLEDQRAKFRRARQVVSYTMTRRVFARYRPLPFRIDGRFIGAFVRVWKINPPAGEPFIQKPNPPGIAPSGRRTHNTLDPGRGDGGE